MKLFTKIGSFFFSGVFSFFASVASIVSLFIIIFKDEHQTMIALIAFIVFLLLIIWKVFSVLNIYIVKKTEDGFHKFATYMKYSTNDGKHITYEAWKYIQCKSFIMDEHSHEYFWTGETTPIIKSNIQSIAGTYKNEKGYDCVKLKFLTPLTYNDFAVVHIKMDLDDTHNKSQPYLEQKVKDKIQLINFRVELRHIKAKKDARILKKKIDSPGQFEIIDYVSFDTVNKSFEYNMPNPEVGYYYRLSWDK